MKRAENAIPGGAAECPASLPLRVAETYEQMSREAAQHILDALEQQPGLLLCVSAGSTPTRTLSILANHRQDRPALFHQLRVIQIDEWGGLPPGNPATGGAYMKANCVEPLGLDEERFQGFCSQPADPVIECARMAQWLAQHGPIDLCLLGLGLNGHIALNEPADTLKPHVHVAALAETSLHHTMLRASPIPPSYGLTLGMADILQSRQIMLLVNGAHKRSVLQRLLEPIISTRFPASFLWLHRNTLIFCDRDAAMDPQGRISQ